MKMILAPPELVDVVAQELGGLCLEQKERLFIVDDHAHSFWAQNIWSDVQKIKFESISEAAKHLRAIQRNWWLHSVTAHRRANLIQDKLPPLKQKPVDFLAAVPTAPMGGWTLWDEETLLYSATCSSPYPNGEIQFNENRTGPPSRAYLKLWEYFTTSQHVPKAGEKVLDLGSSPGGWTWVLDQLGCHVISVDKAPLSSTSKFSSRVKHIEESAFGLDPKTVGAVDWLFSDIICYPERLLQLVNRWRESGMVKNFVCTIKFQGPTNMDVVKEFSQIPGSKVQHLFHNKHELTWSLRNERP